MVISNVVAARSYQMEGMYLLSLMNVFEMLNVQDAHVGIVPNDEVYVELSNCSVSTALARCIVQPE